VIAVILVVAASSFEYWNVLRLSLFFCRLSSVDWCYFAKTRAKSASNVAFCTSRLANDRFQRLRLVSFDQPLQCGSDALCFIHFGLLQDELCRKQNNQTPLFVRVDWQTFDLGAWH
jgi:hypothetical protein